MIENIYNCYVACNELEFRNAYGKCGAEVSYEDCVLDFMPYKEGIREGNIIFLIKSESNLLESS